MDDTTKLIPARLVWERYNICDRTLGRWIENKRLDFPAPLVVNGRRYWKLADLWDWELKRSSAVAK